MRLDLAGFTLDHAVGAWSTLDDALQVVREGDLRAQTRFVLETIRTELERQGTGMNDSAACGSTSLSSHGRAFPHGARRTGPPLRASALPGQPLIEVTSVIKTELLIEIDATP